MKAKEGDVIRFYFSESTGYTKERTNNNTEMVDIVVEDKGELVALNEFGSGCYLFRIDDGYTILGDLDDQEAIESLLSNGWTYKDISITKKMFNI